MAKSILEILKNELKLQTKNQLLDYLIVEFTYNSNSIEGSTLTLADTQAVYEHNKILTGNHSVDDVIEARNHIEAIKYIINTAAEPLTSDYIKKLHFLLKDKTMAVKTEPWLLGEYKKDPNRILGTDFLTTKPEKVSREIDSLLKTYNEQPKTLKTILDFHQKFEKIHPFFDGNGRVGRLIMMKELLNANIMPFIIIADTKQQYINVLHQAQIKNNLQPFIKYANRQQEIFRYVYQELYQSGGYVELIDKF